MSPWVCLWRLMLLVKLPPAGQLCPEMDNSNADVDHLWLTARLRDVGLTCCHFITNSWHLSKLCCVPFCSNCLNLHIVSGQFLLSHDLGRHFFVPRLQSMQRCANTLRIIRAKSDQITIWNVCSPPFQFFRDWQIERGFSLNNLILVGLRSFIVMMHNSVEKKKSSY